MKHLLLFLLLTPLASQAITPEKILPKTLVLKSTDWYSDQAKAWQSELTHDSHNAQSWFNYYAASYFSQDKQILLDQIVQSMAASVPNSYEYWVVKGWNSGYTLDALPFLKKAYEMSPEKPQAYGLLQFFAELNFDAAGRESFSKQLLTSSQLSPSLLCYSYNVLMSLEPSSVLITEGESTTSPLFVLQDVMKLRKDVSILNLDLLTNASYLEKKINSLGLTLNGPVDLKNLRSNLCMLLPSANSDKKFYYALTVSKDNLSSIKKNLYVVGLASVHSLTNFDNISQIKKNLEKEFLLDYLRVDFNGESQAGTGKVLSSNYLLPMLLLYESYLKESKEEQAKELRQLMEQVARDCGKEDIVANLLNHENNSDEIPYFPFTINIKSLEGKFRAVSDKIYAQGFEVTNEEYNLFLQYLSSHSLTELHNKYKFDFSSYDEPALSLMKNYSADRVHTKKQKYFTQYPAVDISYEAANAYCDWLTQQYNNSSEHKFKKVKFRLPSIDEWQIAAASIKNPVSWKLNDQKAEVKILPPGQLVGKNAEKKVVSLSDPEILYPWFRYFAFRNSAVNHRGCYLGNFKVPDVGACPGVNKFKGIAADGFLLTSPVGTYFPNDIGLSDVVGNVAEMTLEKGKACGGSWNHTPEESTIRSINTYTKPDAAIGFRVFMEIVEK